MRRWHLRKLLVLTALGFAGGCEACQGEPVPFKRDEASHASRLEARADAGRTATVAAPVTRAGERYPAGTSQITLAGHAAQIPQGEVRASLSLEGPGDAPAAWLLLTRTDDKVQLHHAASDENGALTPTALATLDELPPGCMLETAQLKALSAAHALAHTTYACDRPGTQLPLQTLWAVRTERAPRLLERFSIWPEALGEPGTISADLHARDQDGDGQADLLLDVSLDAGEPPLLTLTWLDRTGGPGRDPSEPEATLQGLAGRARKLLGSDPAAALEAADAALHVHRLLCRQGERARLSVGSQIGLDCGRSSATGHAAATRALALAEQRAVSAAVRAATALDDPAYTVAKADREAVRQAISQLADPGAGVPTQGPRVSLPRTPPVHLPAVIFADARQLRLRQARPQLYDLTTGERSEVAALPQDDLVMRDPTGRLAVVDVMRTCDGVRLRIVRASQVVLGMVASGASVAQPLVEPRPTPASLGCDRNPAAHRSLAAELTVLGWSPAGIVVASADETRLVPLDASGRALGDPRVIPPSAPLPDGLARGRVSADGTRFVHITPAGIMLRSHGAQPGTRLVQPPGFVPHAAPIQGAALSDDGRSLAVLWQDRALVLHAMGAGS